MSTPWHDPWPHVPRRRAVIGAVAVVLAVATMLGVQTYTTAAVHHQRTQIGHLQREIARLEQLLIDGHIGSTSTTTRP